MADTKKARKPLPELTPTSSGDALYHLLGNLAKVLYKSIASINIEGKEKLPRKQGYIVVANHSTMLDPVSVAYPLFITGTLPRFLAKDSLFYAPVLGFILRKLAHIPVTRGSVDARKSLETAQNIIQAGGAVIIYPEGTLTKDPEGWPMVGRTGAARLALSTGAPVYPIAHWGDEKILPVHGKFSIFPRHKVYIKIGDPIDLANLVDNSEGRKFSRNELQKVTDTMLDQVTNLLADLRGEEPPTGRWNPATKTYEQTES